MQLPFFRRGITLGLLYALAKDPWYGDKSQSTLWEEKKPAANRIHPTAKPVELVERALVNSSKAGDLVVVCSADLVPR